MVKIRVVLPSEASINGIDHLTYDDSSNKSHFLFQHFGFDITFDPSRIILIILADIVTDDLN